MDVVIYITDHQGNIRAVTDATGTVEQANDYRPFGSEFDAASTGTNPGLDRRYGGKEKDATQPSSPFYDFEARMYNTVYARFTTMDPLAEKYYSISPYAYCAGNPVNYTDTDGTIIRDKTGAIVYVSTGKTGNFLHPSGRKATLEIGFVFANNGTPVQVFRNIGKDRGWDTNCHGVSFTDGQYWLNNDQVRFLVKEDGYETVSIENAVEGDIIVYHGDSGYEHSMTIIRTNGTLEGTEVYGQGGLDVDNHIDRANEAWDTPSNSMIYRKVSPDRVISTEDIRIIEGVIAKNHE